MILKASQRGGAKQLGQHLLKTEENEHVEVHEVRGFVSDDVIDAFQEAYAVSRGTRCKQFLFSVSMNPPPSESVGVNVFEQTADRIEAKTGLKGHPRVIVFHEKEGRRHAHVVWSRIDAEEMKAVNLSHFKSKLRDISKELYLENDWQMPRGFIDSEARDPRNFTLAEWQQAKRMGHHARDLKSMMQECWAASDSRAAFEHALGERGIVLAKGDRRGHVAVTHDGEVLSVARYIDKKAKDVRAKLGEPDALPSVDDAKSRLALDMGNAFKRHVGEARTNHAQEQTKLDARRQDMTAIHAAERQKLDAAQRERWNKEILERETRLNKGIRGVWDRLTGKHGRIVEENQKQAYEALQRDREQRDSLVAAQLKERQELQKEIQEARSKQAALLLLLRQDRQEQRKALDVPERQEPKPAPARSPEVRREASQRQSAPPVKENFKQVAEQRQEPPQAVRTVPEAPPRQPEPPVVQQPQPKPTPANDHAERLAALRQEPKTPTPEPVKAQEQPQPDISARLEQLRQQNQPQPPTQTPDRDRG